MRYGRNGRGTFRKRQKHDFWGFFCSYARLGRRPHPHFLSAPIFPLHHRTLVVLTPPPPHMPHSKSSPYTSTRHTCNASSDLLSQSPLESFFFSFESLHRLLFCCTNPCKVIAPIRSRCVSVRVAAPTHAEVCSVLSYVAGKEGIKLPQPLALRISEACDRNLRRAILAMEACRVSQYPLTDAQPVALPDWQLYIQVRFFSHQPFPLFPICHTPILSSVYLARHFVSLRVSLKTSYASRRPSSFSRCARVSTSC